MKKLTTEEFIERAKKIHGDKYDYSNVKYYDSCTKVCIVCPEHGEFWQQPRVHLNGGGCSICSHNMINKLNTRTTEEFITEAKKVHNNRYDYSKVEYTGCFDKVCIVCPEHGEFWQTPDNHLHGHGCQKCLFEKLALINRSNIDEFIAKAKLVHGNKYDYSKAKYVNSDTPVEIICSEHGVFKQSPYNHLHGCSCPNCKNWRLEEDISSFLDDNGIKYERQKKFDWLGRQSLDIFIPENNIAIECQGIQHYKPVNYFGGIKGFKNLVRLDKQKKRLCEENGITLLYYSDKVLNDNVICNKEEILKRIKGY